MSRVGKMPVVIPQGVKVTVTDDLISVEGPKGKLEQDYKPLVVISVEGQTATVTRKDDSKPAKSYHGLYRNLLNNMVTGVTSGFSKTLVINGVGYRAELKGKILALNLGYSNSVEYVVPEGVTVEVEGQNKVTVKGIDKVLVGRVASEIRSIRPPEPYKGKGVKYENEYVRRKVGKSGIK
ncbi:50S ribosomal protein L6 [Spirochaeta lutea]|uniref:Large ribosomal subunit protein uL6 n=1 Tax=Spirochaeta lutea TaxID=1480694 RepID=A0A098QSY2_9SPIO|nr:50S ribosomal protein L6 [Spirochaeta lutea]KGE70676.1 50S ribosomal protein L6 [Spirochaeta lutea]